MNLIKILALTILMLSITSCSKSSLQSNDNHGEENILTGTWQEQSSSENTNGYTLNIAQDTKTLYFSCNKYYNYYSQIEDWDYKDNTISFTIFGQGNQIDKIYGAGEECDFKISLKDKENLEGYYTYKGQSSQISFKKTGNTPKTGLTPEKLTPQEMREDLNVIYSIIENEHPFPYWHFSKDDYIKEKEKLDKKLENLSLAQFYFECRTLLAKFYDIHLSINPAQDWMDKNNVFPFHIIKLDNYYVEETDETNQDILGLQILKINGIAIDEAIEKLLTAYSIENKEGIKLLHYHPYMTYIFKNLGLSDDESKTILTLKDADGNISEKTILSQKYSEFKNKKMKSCIKPYNLTAQSEDKVYLFEEINADMLYIQYNNCSEDKNLPMVEFANQVKNQIETKNYKKIVFDLRHNQGGDSNVILPLVDVLKTTQESQKFDFYILSDYTASASIGTIQYLKQSLKSCTIVGRPTIQNSIFFGSTKYFSLPNSRAWGQYPTEMISGDAFAPIEPDMLIELSIEDVVNGKDKDLETIISIK